METKPNFPPTSQRMVVAFWSREEGSAHWSVPRCRKRGIISLILKGTQSYSFPAPQFFSGLIWISIPWSHGYAWKTKGQIGAKEICVEDEGKSKISLNWECRLIWIYAESHSAAVQYGLKVHQRDERVVTLPGPINLLLPVQKDSLCIVYRSHSSLQILHLQCVKMPM